MGAGYVDFPLIAFHFQQDGIISAGSIPLYYVLGMAVAVLASLGLGRIFDRKGFVVVILAGVVPAAFAPLVFLGGAGLALVGMALWGLGIAGQESIVRAVVADMIPADERASGYGVFNAGFGLAWFLGSSTMGILYDRSVRWLVVVSVGLQLAAVPLLLTVWRRSLRD